MIHCKPVNKHIDFTKYILFKHHMYMYTLRVKGMIAFRA